MGFLFLTSTFSNDLFPTSFCAIQVKQITCYNLEFSMHDKNLLDEVIAYHLSSY